MTLLSFVFLFLFFYSVRFSCFFLDSSSEKKNVEINVNLRENIDPTERKKNRNENQRNEYPTIFGENNNKLNNNRNHHINNRHDISMDTYYSGSSAVEKKNHYSNDQMQMQQQQQQQQLRSSKTFDEYSTRNIDRKRDREINQESSPGSLMNNWGGNRDRNGSDIYTTDRSTDREGGDKRYEYPGQGR